MSERWDVVSFRKTRNDKTYAVRCGSAVQKQDGGWALYLDAMPAPVDGQYQMNVVRPRQQQSRPANNDGPDDEVPF